MRRQDVLGNDRPIVTTVIPRPQIALPDSIDLTPIHLPRAHVDPHDDYVRDIQDPSYHHTRHRSSEGALRYATAFPDNLTTRRLSSIELADFASPSSRSPELRVRTSQGLSLLDTNTDGVRGTGSRSALARREISATGNVTRQNSESPTERPLRSGSPSPLQRPTLRGSPQPSVTFGSQPALDDESITGSLDSINQRALYRNPSLSYQRFLFTLTKFPALVLVMCSLWTLWGRGEGITLVSNEQGADISSLVTGGFVLSCQVLLLHQHYNSYKKAKYMNILYHFAMLGSFCGSVVSLAFAATSFKTLKGMPFSHREPCKLSQAADGTKHPEFCLSIQDRINYLAVILGADSMIIMLALVAMVFGAYGQHMMKQRRAEEYQRLTSSRAYANQALQY